MERILVVDDEPFICENLERILGEEGYWTRVASAGSEALELLSAQSVDLVLLDLNLPDMSGLDVLKEAKERDPSLLVIVITGYASVESAVQAIKAGAYDYLKKPFKADAIKLIVKLALVTQRLKREVDYLSGRHGGKGDPIVAESPQFRKVLDQVAEVAKHPETTVLITGESGTGKELVARRVHQLSERCKRPFLEVNCAALPESLLESELFGYEKGAFSGASRARAGLFEAAEGGTIFLDEIGDMDLGLQAKLLRVLEDKKVRRLGGTRNRAVDVRIVAATNSDLHRAVQEKRFREDLYYRLNIFPIQLPPLRSRPADIEALAKFFLSQYAQKFGRRFARITPEAQDLFRRYSWPGNVRELKNVIGRICIMHDGQALDVDMVPREIAASVGSQALSREGGFDGVQATIDLEAEVERFTRKLLEEALARSGGNISQAAKLLGIPRGTLRYKLEKYAISTG
ncbi:two component, sigma54 specific, transcriptional regulator, Fis family [Desulfacinum hydrothermale DSM 13146]|uniref:Two component, sigma54 specific, transcriptional regulator, Fis family n=1 Tax=Desulfacinum hydrothermale DSM 13146 TaxID=1121390 RepID=A0A1W1XP30_9BACT|nr:sigma-54 dependent transcriptional regulator [Desulfacinum hydrothermale]SMC25271.1 two component, sigma54 specific, transcriptional regulator, Fis family [Desulfacinum hydrothermale DSM 13146]